MMTLETIILDGGGFFGDVDPMANMWGGVLGVASFLVFLLGTKLFQLMRELVT